MNRWLLIATLLLLPVSSMAGLEAFTPQGDPWRFQIPSLDGREQRLADYRGQVVLVNFWASWCTPCLSEMPSIRRLSTRFRDRGFQVLAINLSEKKSTIERRIKRFGIDFTVLMDRDGTVFQQWQGTVLPTSYLVDREDFVRYRAVGPMAWDADSVYVVVEFLLQEE